MHITKENNFYILHEFDLDTLLIKLKDVITDYDPKVYEVIFDKVNDNTYKIHRFFALELYILFKLVNDLKNALTVYEQTHVNQLFKPKPAEQPDLSVLQQISNKTPKEYQALFINNYGKLKSLFKLDGYMLAMQPGMGKSLTAILTALAYSKKQILILAPKTLVESTWAVELEELGITDYTVFPKSKLLNKRFIITNYERAKDLKSGCDIDFIIIDESQNFRFADKKKIQDIYALKQTHNVHNILLLTGTPIKGLYAEFSAAFLLLDPYFDMDAYPYFYNLYSKKSIAGERLLKERIEYYMFKLTYDRVKDEFVLPPLHQITKEISLPHANRYTINQIRLDIKYAAEQCKLSVNKKEIIDKLNKEYNANIKEDDNVETIALKKQEVLSRIESNTEKKKVAMLFNSLIAPEIYCLSKNIANAYISRLKELVIELFKAELPEFKKLIQQNEKIVVFTNYVSIADQLKELFDKELNLNSKVVTGKYSLDKRTESIKQFKLNPNADIIIITYKAASYGLTLTEARYLYYADLPFRDADLKQAIARIYRLTQKREAYAIYLKLKSEEMTIQERKEKILEIYRELVSKLLDIPLKEPILEELYEDLEKLILK